MTKKDLSKEISEAIVKQIESLDFPIPSGEITFPEEILIEWPLALSTKHKGKLTKLNLLFGKRCTSTEVLDVCGSTSTGRDGTVEFKLSDNICIPRPQAGQNFDRIISPGYFVATAHSTSPVHATFQIRVQNGDALIKLFTWDPTGNPAANVKVHWKCCVQIIEVVG